MSLRIRMLAAALLLPFTACTAAGESPSGDVGVGAGHTHSGAGGPISLPVGDGTRGYEVGYRLRDVRLTAEPGVPGEVGFTVDYQDEPQTEFLVEQTKRLHLYVVRADLTAFRHLHPTVADDGTWTAPVTLPTGGSYRVIGEFVAQDAGGGGDHVVLGQQVEVAGAEGEDPPDEADPTIEVEVTSTPQVGDNGRLGLLVRDARGRPVRLDTYLGTWAHVTGFHKESGAMVHLHPMSEPTTTEDGSGLVFHAEVEQAGDYRLFVQVRVDGFVHTVPVEMTVS